MTTIKQNLQIISNCLQQTEDSMSKGKAIQTIRTILNDLKYQHKSSFFVSHIDELDTKFTFYLQHADKNNHNNWIRKANAFRSSVHTIMNRLPDDRPSIQMQLKEMGKCINYLYLDDEILNTQSRDGINQITVELLTYYELDKLTKSELSMFFIVFKRFKDILHKVKKDDRTKLINIIDERFQAVLNSV
jgi:hypothetical protein